MIRPVLAVLLLLTACGSPTTESTNTTVEMPATSSSTTTTTSTSMATTSPTAPPIDLECRDMDPQSGPSAEDAAISLQNGNCYQFDVDEVRVRLTPPQDGWRLYGYRDSAEEAGLMVGWTGPTGFRKDTLNVLIFDAGATIDDAWARIEDLGDRAAAEHGKAWESVADGQAEVGGIEAEWREVRTPILDGTQPGSIDDPYYRALAGGLNATLWVNTSARFFVVPIGELTFTVVAYETRCACQSTPDPRTFRGDQMADEDENELAMWMSELEALLAGLSFEES